MRTLLLSSVVLLVAFACDGGGEGTAEDGGSRDPLGAWEDAAPGEVVPATLTFTEPLLDSTVVMLLDAAGVRPYRAWVAAGGVRSLREVPRSQASSEFVARLRDDLLSELRITQCAQPGRAAAILGSWEDGANRVTAGRVALANLQRIEDGAASLAAEGAYVAAVSVVGTVEDVREAASDPRVAELGVASRGEGAEPPEPGWTDAPPGEVPPAIRGLPAEEVRKRLQVMAEEVDGCGPRSGGEPPDSPLPPTRR